MFVKQEYNRKLLPRVNSAAPVDVDLEFELNTVSGLVSSVVYVIRNHSTKYVRDKLTLQDEVNQVMTTVGFIVAVSEKSADICFEGYLNQ